MEETRQLGQTLRASVKEAEAATYDPDLEEGVGGRTLLAADVAILEGRAKSYLQSVENGLGREDTRSLFGRIEALVGLTANDARRLPDYGKYRSQIESLQRTVKALGRYYAEELRVTPPPDPLREREREREQRERSGR